MKPSNALGFEGGLPVDTKLLDEPNEKMSARLTPFSRVPSQRPAPPLPAICQSFHRARRHARPRTNARG